jgi:flagellar basal-body rod protein FlgB
MDRLDRFFGVHGAALTLRSERMQILASNIANAATPGYKARDIDFRALIGDAGATGAASVATTQAGHQQGTSTADARLLYRQPLQPSLDGNSVELATEQLQFAETAIRYRSTLSMLGSRISGLMSALKGE